MFAPSTRPWLRGKADAVECSPDRAQFLALAQYVEIEDYLRNCPGNTKSDNGASLFCAAFTEGEKILQRLEVRDSSRFVKKANAPKRLVMGTKSKYNCAPWQLWKRGFWATRHNGSGEGNDVVLGWYLARQFDGDSFFTMQQRHGGLEIETDMT